MLTKSNIKNLISNTLVKFYMEILKVELDSHTHNYAGSSSAGGAATSANKVNSSLSIQLNSGSTEGTNKFTFNGSSAKSINITPSSIGAAVSSHGTHVTYTTTTPKANGTATVGSESKVARGDHVHPAQTTISGNAGSADKVNNKITVKLNSGTTEGTNLFTYDGSSAKTINITASSIGAAASNHGTHVSFPSSGTPAANGTASLGSASTVSRSDHVHPTQTTITGNAGSANKVNNTLSIQLNSGTATVFDGSADKSINITPSSIGAAASSHGTHVTYSTTTPKANGTATVGTESKVARGDHVHPLQTSVSGNAGTATKLATARTITLSGAVSGSTTFDGSGNKTITTSITSPSSGAWWTGYPKVGSQGTMDIGKYLDFHLTDTETDNYTGRIYLKNNTGNNINIFDFGESAIEPKGIFSNGDIVLRKGNKLTMHTSANNEAYYALNHVLDTNTNNEILRVGSTKVDYINHYSNKGHRFIVGSNTANTEDTASGLEIFSSVKIDGEPMISIRPYVYDNATVETSIGEHDNPVTYVNSDYIYSDTISSPPGLGLDLMLGLELGYKSYPALLYRKVTSSGTTNFYFNPDTENKVRLGSSSYKWASIWCEQTSLNSSSDRRLKTDIDYFQNNKNIEDFYMDLKPCTYKKIDSEFDRRHCGLIAQELEESMNKYSIDYTDFAALLKIYVDENGDEININDAEHMKKCTDTQYGIRYGEFTALNIHMIQKLYNKINELEEKIAILEDKQNAL